MKWYQPFRQRGCKKSGAPAAVSKVVLQKRIPKAGGGGLGLDSPKGRQDRLGVRLKGNAVPTLL